MTSTQVQGDPIPFYPDDIQVSSDGFYSNKEDAEEHGPLRDGGPNLKSQIAIAGQW